MNIRLNQTFLRNLEPSIKKHGKKASSKNPLEILLKEKHSLDRMHSTIVTQALNPFIGSNTLKSDKSLSRGKDFLGKKIHRILCPTILSNEENQKPQSPMLETIKTPISTEEIASDYSFTQPQIFLSEKTSQTTIFYAEDLFGTRKTVFNSPKAYKFDPKKSRILIKAKMNNPFTRRIAGSNASTSLKNSKGLIDDPLESKELLLPRRLRSETKNSPWIYSSVLRTNSIFKVKTKSRYTKNN